MVRRMWIALLLMGAVPASAQVDARMFRQPAVSADKIAFVYAGDIWLVPKSGGAATRLSSPLGEESFPRFSPDGTRLAYSADYDGNTDVYVVPDGRRRARAAHASPDGGSRHRLASRRQACALRIRPRERAAALQPVLSRRVSMEACRRSCPCRTASSAPSRRTARASCTCRCRRTSATGSAIAAAGRPTSGCSI